MSEYEGLNLPELLELMHPIVMPEPVSRFPEGPGWWILGGWLLAVSLLVTWHLLQRRRRSRYRREAGALLDEIGSWADRDPPGAAAEIAVVLKQTALAAYPRERVAALSGDEWARFLCESAGNDAEVARVSQQLASAAYDPRADGRQMLRGARRWIRAHHA